MTGFTDGEEEEMQLTKVVPFLVEDELMRLGAIFKKGAIGLRSRLSMGDSLPARIPRRQPQRLKRC